MPTLYAPRRARSRKSPPSLSGIANALGAHLADEGPTKVGRVLGEATSTIHGWSADLHRWSLAAGLILGRHVPSIGAAMTAFITGTEITPAEPTAAISEAYETATRASDLIREILAAVRNGEISRAESRQIITRIKSLAAILPKLERDAKAAAR